jgi:hypothetical protein
MILFEWINSLNQWQQAVIGIPCAIIIAFLFMYVYNLLRHSYNMQVKQ